MQPLQTPIKIPATARAIAVKILDESQGGTYIVGGYVRDSLLGLKPKDCDLVVCYIDEEELERIFPEAEKVGKDFPVWLIDGHEVALARREKKSGLGHSGFTYEVDRFMAIETDLLRRDFNINAMALWIGPRDLGQEIVDPYDGQEDLELEILLPVSRAFCEDPLRVLRAARFAAQLDFELTDELVNMVDSMREELEHLTPERVFAELQKGLRTQNPAKFFQALDEMDVLYILFPELHALKGRTQPTNYHPEGDAYVHTLECLQRARELGANDLEMFCTLTHDLGKAVTDDDNLPHHYDHERLGVPIVSDFCDRLKVPSAFKKAAKITCKEHLNIHRFEKMRAVKKVRLIERLGGLQRDLLLESVALASQADAQGRGEESRKTPYPQRELLIKAAGIVRSVKGDQYANLTDGKKIAQKMEQDRTKALKEAGF